MSSLSPQGIDSITCAGSKSFGDSVRIQKQAAVYVMVLSRGWLPFVPSGRFGTGCNASM